MIMAYSNFIVLLLMIVSCSVLPPTDCRNNGITIDLHHRDSPLSPFYNPYHTRFDRIKNAAHRSFSRKASLNPTSISTKKAAFGAPIQSDTGEYLMKISLGTPPFETVAIADTGSDLLWTQCIPCTECYDQTLPLFDPKISTSYRGLSCQSQPCTALESSSCDSNNVCQYSASYGDKSHTNGDLAAETLTLQSNNGESISFPKTVFGCGHDNGGTFHANGSGIVGLGGGPISIVNQLKQSIGGKFSYCLTQIKQPNVTSKISFGNNALVSGPNVVSTPLIPKSRKTYYYLNLEGISVGSTKILYKTLKSANSSTTADEEGNIIIDSGTTLTFLPQQIYDELELALIKAINGGQRVTEPPSPFNLCYQASGDNFDAPTIVAHFTGADVELPSTNTFHEVEDGVVCLTVTSSQDLAIFGNLNQMNYLVGYDLVNNNVSFRPTDCSKPV